jgi:hypothetical protein
MALPSAAMALGLASPGDRRRPEEEVVAHLKSLMALAIRGVRLVASDSIIISTSRKTFGNWKIIQR